MGDSTDVRLVCLSVFLCLTAYFLVPSAIAVYEDREEWFGSHNHSEVAHRAMSKLRARQMKLAKLLLSLFSFGAAIVAISMSWAADEAACMSHTRGFSATYSFAKNCGYIYLALKASLTRFPINHITTFEKIVIGSLLFAFPLAGMATAMSVGLMVDGICAPIQYLQNLILAIIVDAFWNFSCMALFNIPLTLHAKSIKKDNESLKKMLQRNLLGCILVVVMANVSMGLMIYSIYIPNPFAYYVTFTLCIELVAVQFVAWQQTQKKHPNESSTASKQSKFSAVPTEEHVGKDAEKKLKSNLQNLAVSASQSPLVPVVVQQSSEDTLAISGSLRDDRSEPVTPLSEEDPNPSNEPIRSLSSSNASLPGKEDEPKILARRVSEMDESDDALVVKPNPLFQGHLGA